MSENEKGPMFTFVWGSYPSEKKKLVVVYKGKKKFTKKELEGFNNCFTKTYDKIDGYVFLMWDFVFEELFEKSFIKTIKPGKVRYGRLQLKLIKRKKK